MSSFCTAKATHIFSTKNFSIFAYHSVNFNELLTNDIFSFEQLGPVLHHRAGASYEYPQHMVLWRHKKNIITVDSRYLKFQGTLSVLQLGFEGRGVLGRALFAQSYKNEGTMCHVSCDVLSIKTCYKM